MSNLNYVSRQILWIIPVLGLLGFQPLMAQSGPPLNIQPSGNNRIQVTWPPGINFNVLQETIGLGATNAWQDVSDAPFVVGTNYALLRAATNSAGFYRLARRGMPGTTTPPDPASVAPPLAPNVFNPFGASTAFLYTGSNAVQVGVAPGTINAVQAAVLRGTVKGRNNIPLPGVRVALVNHPEFGYTYTRTNGMFDLAVNAAQYTVDFQAIGYLEVQRQAQLTGQSYAMLPDVMMIGLDSMATTVTLSSNAAGQLAPSTPQTDAAGTRSAMVFFPPGTTATMLLPDGTTQALSTLTVRVTEYTVGSNGPMAMPATLPPNSAYTYCAEFTTDEQLAAGATTVQFSQPVPVYVDDFLNVPVGTLMPLGNYDRIMGAWMPSSNGIVMQVLGSTNGIALVDLHGSGQPETANLLAANGFTTQELQQLATLYPGGGKTLWRCPLPHFCPWDFNFLKNPPAPNLPPKNAKPKGSPNDKSPNNYGTLNFSAQTFTEEIPLVGIPFDLHYNSARVPDYRVNSQQTIPVKWVPPPPTISCQGTAGVCVAPPDYLERPPSNIRVDMAVDGEPDAIQILPETDTSATVAWDGRDAYGRLVGGTCQANVTVAYQYTNWNYAGIFGGPELSAEFPDLFGNDGNQVAFEGHVGAILGIGATFQELFNYPDHRGLGFGGWSPTVLHRFDPVGGILYYGDGRIRTVPQTLINDSINNQITSDPERVVAAAPDGSVYFDAQLNSIGNFIFRRLPGGGIQIITASPLTPGIVSPSGNWSQVDGQPVGKVSLASVSLAAMSVGPDGSLYVTDGEVIARLTPDGIWHVILGLNVSSPATLQPDGTPAINSYATDGGRMTMAVGPDSCVYFTGEWSSADGKTNYFPIRKIAPDGRLYTVFGAPGTSTAAARLYWFSLYGTSAFAAPYGGGPISAIAVANDGTIYVSPGESQDGGGMFKISPAGVILPFLSEGPATGAGLGYNPNDTNNLALIQGDEGRQAIQVTHGGNSSQTLAVGPDGSVYFTDSIIVWRVNPDGILERVAGRFGSTAYNLPNSPDDGADPLNTYYLNTVNALAVTPNDTLVMVRADLPPYIQLYPGRTAQQGLLIPIETQNIPSEDGSEIYVFDLNGRHLSTLDSLTGAPKWTFGYDNNSLVVTMTDGAGLVTRIQRDGAGHPTAIVGPYGQTTTLGLDANGFLSKVSNPANETTLLTNTIGGSLTSITGPLGDTYNVSYDNLGRVTQVSDPLGGGWTDTMTDVGVLDVLSYEIDVACTNSLGDTLSRTMVLEPNWNTEIEYFSGTNITEGTLQSLDGDYSTYFSDGTSLSVGTGADPRFGSQVKQPISVALQVSSGLAYTESILRSAGLTTSGDPLSLTGLTNVTTINGNSYTTVYNPTNRTITSTTPVGRSVTNLIDELGRIIRQTEAGAPVTDVGYDASGRLGTVTNISSIGAATTTFSYDSLGQLSTVTDPLGRSNFLTYDAAGRIKQLVIADGSPFSLNWDAEYNLTSVTPPGRPAHNFQYDAVGLLTKYTPPVVGSDESVGYAYDTERNVKQINFPDGQIATFQHGLADRIEQAVLGVGPTLTYQYGATPGAAGYLQPVAVTSSTGDAINYGYAGPIQTNVIWSGSVTGQVALQLNVNLLPASKSVDGATVAFGYDTDGLLTQAGGLGVNRDPVTGFITGTSLGVVTDQRQYDDAGLITNYTATANGTLLWSLTMSYDLLERLTNKVETIGGQTQTHGYVYDVADRLQQVWLNGALATTYTYDTNGNRLTRNSETASYDAQDRVTSYNGMTFGWSHNGNLLSTTNGGQPTTYSYDVRGALTSVALPGGEHIGYIIDAEGRRIGKQVNGLLQRGWLWDSDRVAAQVDGNSSLTEQFIYGADDSTPSYMIAGANTYRILSDEGGSVRLVVNVADGTVAQRLDYDEFGRVLGDSNPGFQPLGFNGGLYDPETGLVRFGARDYSSETGQWTARDPILFDGGQSSLYAYVDNDPINFLDELGTGPNHRLSPHQRNLVIKAGRSLRGAAKADGEVADVAEHHRIELGENIEFVLESTRTVGISLAFEHAGKFFGSVGLGISGIAGDVVEGVGKVSDGVGEVINTATDNGLMRPQNEAKKAGDLTGPNSKNMRPFNIFDPSSWGL
jgi:RHS repeat-associated protein